jgi:hypothetical protein
MPYEISEKFKARPKRFHATLLFAILTSFLTIDNSAFAAKVKGCTGNGPNCPISLTLREERWVTLRGRLSRERMSYSYTFFSQSERMLSWRFRGPAIRALISNPDGETDGPGLPKDLVLKQSGNYVFSVTSNTMADKIFGRFTLQLRLRKAP